MSSEFNRRDFLKRCAAVGVGGFMLSNRTLEVRVGGKRPNIILCMCDDLGWGDPGYNGHPVLKTASLDEMAASGIRFDRFYSGAPVCSPTRGGAMTGRHPYRYGIFSANKGHMKEQEITLAEVLKTLGYTTGHFGKWHLGTLTTEIKDSNRGGPGSEEHYSPPWDNGFDVCYSTEAKVPTWDPMKEPGTDDFYGTYYWKEDGTYVSPESPELAGDDSRIIMDQAIPFIRNAVKKGKNFLAVVWFHTPHKPVVAGPKYLEIYAGQSEAERHYYGCVTAMDEQVGRLRKELRNLGIAEDTMLWFCSDNGPSGCNPGSAGPFRGCKGSLWEGGVRVPGILIWPAKIKKPRVVQMACSTSDYFPTVMDVLGFKMKGQPEPIDGISLLPLIEGKMTSRAVPIGFEHKNQLLLTDNRYKLISTDSGVTYELYDLIDDPGEKKDIASSNPQILDAMKTVLEQWRASCANSLAGNDYI